MLLQELIRVRKDGSKFVSARDLHVWLESKKDFNRWSMQNILNEGYGLKEFIKEFENEPISQLSSNDLEVVSCEIARINVILPQFENTKFKNKVFYDYQLSLRIASHLAMISKCKKGFEARNYFYECEQLYYKQMETNLKLGSMLLTHREKLQLTKELFYPILEKLGVLDVKKNLVHQKIIKSLFGKYENLNKLTKLTDEDVENYKRLAISMQNDTRYFEDKNQITVWDIIKHL